MKESQKKLPTKGSPEIVREGNAQVKIYASTVRGRPRFIVAYRGLDGKRRTPSFADYDRARQEAEVKAIAIHNGTLETLELTGEERRAHTGAPHPTPSEHQAAAPIERQSGRSEIPNRKGLLRFFDFFTRKGRESSSEMVESCLVQAAIPVEIVDDLEEPLCAADQMHEGVYVPVVLYYDRLLNVEILKEALVLTLARFPAIAGRLDVSGNVHCIRGNDGLLWEHFRCSHQPPGPYAARSKWRKAKLYRERGGIPYPRSDESLVFIRVSTFEAASVTIIAMNYNHCLGDGPSYFLFLRHWSWYYSELTGGDLPEAKPDLPQSLGRRIIPPIPDAPKNLTELCEAYHGKPKDPLHWLICALGFVRMMWGFLRSKEVEYRVDAEALTRIKRKVIGQLREKDSQAKSISSAKVLISMLARALYQFSGRRDGKFEVAIYANLRGRSPLFTSSHFANSMTTIIPENVPIANADGDSAASVPLSATVGSIDLELRKAFAQSDKLYWYWPEFARNLGQGDKLWRLLFDMSTHGDLMFNYVVSFPWHSLNMGDSTPPVTMAIPFPGAPDHLNILPLTPAGDVCFSLRLSSAEHRCFRELILAHELPLRQMET